MKSSNPSPESLTTIGILGGMSSAATGEYYRLINEKVREQLGGYEIAEMLIASVNFGNIERFVRAGNWEEAGEYLAEKAKGLETAGAKAIFLATNTMHRVREVIKASISVPFIDIFETVAEEIKRQGRSRIGLLGTYPVMTDQFYVGAFREYGIEILSPIEEDKQVVERIIWEEMTHYQFLPKSKKIFLDVIERLVQQGAEGVILGCTEIKMLISQDDIASVPLFDTTTLHCDKAARICTGELSIPSIVSTP